MESPAIGDLCWVPLTCRGPFWPCQIREMPAWLQSVATPDRTFVHFFGENTSGLIRKRSLLPFAPCFDKAIAMSNSTKFHQALDDLEAHLANEGGGDIKDKKKKKKKKEHQPETQQQQHPKTTNNKTTEKPPKKRAGRATDDNVEDSHTAKESEKKSKKSKI